MGGLGFLRGGLENGGVVVVVALFGLQSWNGVLYDTALLLACTWPGRTLYSWGCFGLYVMYSRSSAKSVWSQVSQHRMLTFTMSFHLMDEGLTALKKTSHSV